MEKLAPSNVTTDISSKMVFVYVLQANSNKIKNVSINPHVKKDFLGMDKNVMLLPAAQDNLTMLDVDVARLQSMSAQLVPIGMDIDVYTLLTSALPV